MLLILSAFVICSCSEKETEKGNGYLMLNISHSTSLKADIELMDFTLRILAGSVEILKEQIGDLPEKISLPVGTYTIEAYSMEFSEPKFETPFYFGRITVDIEEGETKTVSLVCSQGNTGIRIVWQEIFSTLFSTYQARIDSNEGFLVYSSTETRTGYFLPGTVNITIHADGQIINGGAVNLATRDMVTVYMQPNTAAPGELNIKISIDKTLNYRELELIVDPNNIVNNETSPYSIAQAIERQGENEVWITGYIVGSKPSAGYDFVNGVWQATNIVLADNINETNDWNVIFVDLATANVAYRNVLNLVNNPNNLHRRVLIRGNLRQYQSRAGLRELRGGHFSFP